MSDFQNGEALSRVQRLKFVGQNSEISSALHIYFYVGGLPILYQTFDIGILHPNSEPNSIRYALKRYLFRVVLA